MDIDSYFQSLSSSVGFPADQLKFLFSILCSYPACYLFHALPRDSKNLKHLFSIILSLNFLTFCCGTTAWIHSFVSSLVTYLILKFLPHGVAHKVAFAWAFLYMSVSHIYIIYTNYMGWDLDFTTMQMVLTLKLTSFAFNYYDGNRKGLTAEQEKRSIKELPNLLEYFGFVYFFCGFLAGPAIEIREYQKFIDYSMFNDSYCQGEVPPSGKPALKALISGLAFLPLVILSGYFPVTMFTTEAYAHAPIWEKTLRMFIHPALVRMKYYFGWYLSEGACNLIGIGYNGLDKNGKPKWDRCKNVQVLKVEWAPNMRSVTTYWNLRTGDWLKNYVYLRLTPEGQRPTMFATIATYSASAFWHGFYPGYYTFFLTAAILTEIGKDARRIFRPYFVTKDDKPIYPQKYAYDLLTTLTTLWFLNYAGSNQILLSLDYGLKMGWNYAFIGFIGPVIFLVLLRTVLKPKRVKKVE
eukprot:TRINITY_DN4032_c0_g1_i1.p1 TRINITY_DN4032_c0_g1~~TRINITY_DN4032_c0_g1_i1.p1  ORF type:complete len:466 (-),score=113.71 TRINITY_DN4032_c0_g1_i1:43-1440(-)